MGSPFNVPNRTYIVSTAGNINPGVFATLTGDMTIGQSVSGDAPIGITALGARAYNVTYLGIPGDEVGVFGEGQECWLNISTTVTADQLLKPDANGNGIPATSGNQVGAIALEGGTSGSQIKVRVLTATKA
jgi:hypothetical protein